MYGIVKTLDDLLALPRKSVVLSDTIVYEKSWYGQTWLRPGNVDEIDSKVIVLPAVVLFNPEVELREEYTVTWPGWDFPRPDVRPMSENEAKWYLQGDDDGILMTRKVGPWVEVEK